MPTNAEAHTTIATVTAVLVDVVMMITARNKSLMLLGTNGREYIRNRGSLKYAQKSNPAQGRVAFHFTDTPKEMIRNHHHRKQHQVFPGRYLSRLSRFDW